MQAFASKRKSRSCFCNRAQRLKSRAGAENRRKRSEILPSDTKQKPEPKPFDYSGILGSGIIFAVNVNNGIF